MFFAKNICAGTIAGPIRDRFIKALSDGRYQKEYYIIVLSETGHDLLEILPLETFQNPVYLRYHDIDALHVVGIAVTKREADDLLKQIVMKVYKTTGGFNVKEFFLFDKNDSI